RAGAPHPPGPQPRSGALERARGARGRDRRFGDGADDRPRPAAPLVGLLRGSSREADDLGPELRWRAHAGDPADDRFEHDPRPGPRAALVHGALTWPPAGARRTARRLSPRSTPLSCRSSFRHAWSTSSRTAHASSTWSGCRRGLRTTSTPKRVRTSTAWW